jgi:hypothetical protein
MGILLACLILAQTPGVETVPPKAEIQEIEVEAETFTKEEMAKAVAAQVKIETAKLAEANKILREAARVSVWKAEASKRSQIFNYMLRYEVELKRTTDGARQRMLCTKANSSGVYSCYFGMWNTCTIVASKEEVLLKIGCSLGNKNKPHHQTRKELGRDLHKILGTLPSE